MLNTHASRSELHFLTKIDIISFLCVGSAFDIIIISI